MHILKKRLTSFDLKVIGIVFMVFDHIHQMFYFEGIPMWFTIVGRISAPLFLLLSAEGFHYTRNKKKYMWHLLVGFWVCQILFLQVSNLLPNNKIQLMNSIFGTLFLGLCMMWIYDGFFGGKKRILMSILGFLGLIMLTPLTLFIASSDTLPQIVKTAFLTLVPNFLTVEGGIPFIALALIFYISRNIKWLQYLALSLLSLVIFLSNPQGIQWFMIFSLIPIYLYNGKEGRKVRWLFYVFYPAHIIILYIISTLLFT